MYTLKSNLGKKGATLESLLFPSTPAAFSQGLLTPQQCSILSLGNTNEQHLLPTHPSGCFPLPAARTCSDTAGEGRAAGTERGVWGEAGGMRGWKGAARRMSALLRAL